MGVYGINERGEKRGAQGGYRGLVVYRLARLIYDLNSEFCQRYIQSSRTREQMEQASRSGKQNIVEACLEKSLKMNIKLMGVSRGSYGELLEDYFDFLRVRGLRIWGKDDRRVLEIRKIRIEEEGSYGRNGINEINGKNESYGMNGMNGMNGRNGRNGLNGRYGKSGRYGGEMMRWRKWMEGPEQFANLMVTLISKETYLLDQLIRSLERRFVEQGGYSENLSKRRLLEKKRQLATWWRDRWND